MKTSYLLFFVFALTFFSCTRESSDSVNQDKIWAKYELIYDKNENETTVKAEFRFGGAFGTLLELSSPASIKFNGTAVPFNSTLANYSREINGLVSSGTFTYTDVDGNVYTNTTNEIRPVEFTSDAITVNNGTDYVMPFTGPVISGNDVVTATIDTKIFATSQVGASSITLGGVQTADLAAGPYIAKMYRTVIHSPSQVTPEGGTIWLTHKAFNKGINVE